MKKNMWRYLEAKLSPVLSTGRKVVEPPGSSKGKHNKKGTPVLVATFPRSGTHLLIDAILNHFPSYRRTPLYVDIEQVFLNGLYENIERYSCESVVIKSHFPFPGVFEREPIVSEKDKNLYENLLGCSKIVTVSRPIQGVRASLEKFGDCLEKINFEEEFENYHEFWSKYERLEISFESLISTESFPEVVGKLKDFLGEEPNSKLRHPPAKSQRGKVHFQKIAARLFGGGSPFAVNTTIGFDK